MTRGKAQNNQGLIIRRAHTGDYDILVTAFTEERGKIRAMAKNAGRPGSTRAPHLEPITLSTLQVIPGDDLDFITQAVTDEPFAQIKADLENMAQAHCIAETIDALTVDRNPCPEMLHLAVAALNALHGAPPGDGVLRFFEYHALRLNGTQPELHHCVECFEKVQPGQHRFTPQLGGILCNSCQPEQAVPKTLSLRAVKVLRLIQTGDLHRLRSLRMNPPLAAELRNILSATVSFNAGRDIRSNAFLDSIRRRTPRKPQAEHTVNSKEISPNGHEQNAKDRQ